MDKGKHLTLDDRYDIQHSLKNGMSFKAIGRLIGKDCTTISKEIKSHVIFDRKCAPYKVFNDCIHRNHCKICRSLCKDCTSRRKCSLCGKCTSVCKDYEKELCPLLSKPPYVCNGCHRRLLDCTLEKHIYDAHKAHMEYIEIRSESRSGFNLTEEELNQLNSIISPLLKNGQSLHHIMVSNSDSINCCEKTAYTYISNNLFDARNIDLPRLVRFRPRRKKSVELKVDNSCRIGRTYKDFEIYREEHISKQVVEIDTVEGIKGGAVLLTIHFVLPKLQLAFLRPANTSQSVIDIFNQLYDVLGQDNYQKILMLLLADNGTEFSNPKAIEFDKNGNRRSYLFYCNPATPGQKGACENNHEFIRRIIPKGIDIGRYTQRQISIMMDNINSYKRPELGDKSPYEMFEFYYGKKILDLLKVNPVNPNDIILKPELMNQIV